jgi:hypothetical protein
MEKIAMIEKWANGDRLSGGDGSATGKAALVSRKSPCRFLPRRPVVFLKLRSAGRAANVRNVKQKADLGGVARLRSP